MPYVPLGSQCSMGLSDKLSSTSWKFVNPGRAAPRRLCAASGSREIAHSIKTLPRRVRRRLAYAQMERPGAAVGELSFSELMALPDPADRYRYAHHYFSRRAPAIIREHRHYFEQDLRGYGERAFHAMWY